MEYPKHTITNYPAISAIYYALLQCGYEFYSIERDASTVTRLKSFIAHDFCEKVFFSLVRQDTCEVYPYWPRAALLETATFYIDFAKADYADFDAYKKAVLAADNISDAERDVIFFSWVRQFPLALKNVLQSDGFNMYMEWEDRWIEEQNIKLRDELRSVWDILASCEERFEIPFRNVKIVLSPIKCVYSSDHHRMGDDFIFCSGALRAGSVIHEFIHRAVHPAVERRRAEILSRGLGDLDVDASYYLDGGEAGSLNAFEEYMVRKLTDRILAGDIPESIDALFDRELKCVPPLVSRSINELT